MNWDAIGATGEILGALAVVATIVYLAVQIRQNTSQQKREELVSIQHGQNDIVAQLIDPRISGALVRTGSDCNPSIEDRATCMSWVLQYINHFQIVHTLYQNGSIDEEQYQLWLGFAVAVVAPVGIRRWWEEENGRLSFQREVRDIIDERLQDNANPPVPLTDMWSHLDSEEWAAEKE